MVKVKIRSDIFLVFTPSNGDDHILLAITAASCQCDYGLKLAH